MNILQASDKTSRVVFDRSGERYKFRLEVADGDDWIPATESDNVMVAGPSFDLAPGEVELVDERLVMRGVGRSAAGEEYAWSGSVAAIPASQWLRFEVEIDSEGLNLSDDMPEPQITLRLGELPPYERGDHVWFKTLVQNPTQWNHEGQGNDFPATYFYDPYKKAEFKMFFDMTVMSWMGPDNMARFYDYRCGIRRSFGGRPSLELGLIGDGKSGSRFPSGRQRLVWYVAGCHRMDVPSPPTEQEALIQLVHASLPLLRSSTSYWPQNATSWADYATHAAVDLMDTDHCWASDEHGEHLLNYVDGRSDAWVRAMEARGREFNGLGPCLESALWALRPIDMIQAKVEGSQFSALQSRLEQFIRRELQLERSHMLTGITADTVALGTWQYLYKVAESWAIYAARGDREMLDLIGSEVAEVVIPLAEQTQYLFPLQFDKSNLHKIGPGDGYAIAGLFALLMLDIHEESRKEEHLQHAMRSLRVLANLPIDSALQESFLIAHALDAAKRLAELTGEAEWEGYRDYFEAQSLRMMYWYDDRTSAATSAVSHLGMFLACANINYPAFLENIEVDARLAAGWREGSEISVDVLRVIDYGRRNNFSFFPKSSPDMFGPMPLDYIPFEEVPILEGPADAGFVGQEIYGAGWVFRAHLLWDALATCSDREVMILSLDAYREGALTADRDTWEFVAYNSTDNERTVELRFFVAGFAGASVVVDGANVQRLSEMGTLSIIVPPRGAKRLTLKRDAR